MFDSHTSLWVTCLKLIAPVALLDVFAQCELDALWGFGKFQSFVVSAPAELDRVPRGLVPAVFVVVLAPAIPARADELARGLLAKKLQVVDGGLRRRLPRPRIRRRRGRRG